MIRFLGPAGLIMLLVGLGAYYTTGELSGFAIGNMTVGVATLVTSGVASARRFRGFSGARTICIVGIVGTIYLTTYIETGRPQFGGSQSIP